MNFQKNIYSINIIYYSKRISTFYQSRVWLKLTISYLPFLPQTLSKTWLWCRYPSMHFVRAKNIDNFSKNFSFRTASSDKITRNFSHILRQRSFYPIYPPPENVCIDFEGWQNHARIKKMPRIFITASDMANFNKVNNLPKNEKLIK